MKKLICFLLIFVAVTNLNAEEYLPRDNTLFTYHNHPRYRASEEHPVRLLSYAVHPVGWLARELVTRPISAFAGSTEFTRSFFGYRESGDYRDPTCFSATNAVPDCRSILPYNYEVDDGFSIVGAQRYNGDQRAVYFPNVNFDFDSAQINSAGQAKVDEIAGMLEEAPGLVVVLEGHTDYIGTDDYNNTLGMKRAEAVRDALIAQSVSAERLSTVTFGKTKPLIDEQTDEARAQNRRVEVHPEQ